MGCKVRKPKKMATGGFLSGAATGAAAGATLGPLGMVGMGLAGGVMGSISENKQIKQQEELIDKQRLQARQQAFNASLGQQYQNIPLMPYGGSIGSETVELERGEPYMLPNGQIDGISTNAPTHAQGGVDITLPESTEVLGKLTSKEGKQFKELGRRLKDAQSKYQKTLENNPTSIASNTAKRMLDNINSEYKKLFLEQETQKGSTNGLQMPNGGVVTTQRGVSAPYYREVTPTTFGQQGLRKGFLQPQYDTLSVPELNQQIQQYYNISEGFAAPYKAEQDPQGNIKYYKDYGRNQGEYYNEDGSGKVTDTYNNPRESYADGGKIYIKPSKRGTFTAAATKHDKSVQEFASQVLANKDNYSPAMIKKANFAHNAAGWRKGENGLYVEPKSGLIPSTYQQEGLQGISSPTVNYGTQQQTNNVNWGNTLGAVASLLPTAYNLYQGSQGGQQLTASDYYNPYENQIRSTMKDRRYNIQPELEQNRLAQATYQRGLREAAPSQSQYLGGLQAGAINRQRADAQTIARKQNIDNQYLSEQAQMDAQLGAQRAQTRYNIDQFNMQSDAVARGMIGTGLSQISQFAQNQQLMSNQALRDAQRLGLLDNLFANYDFKDGKFMFKGTNTEASQSDIYNFIYGRK